MITNSLKIASTIISLVIGNLFIASSACGDAVTDIQVFLSNGKLATTLSKYAGAFDDATFMTEDPGFAGSLPQSRQYGVQITQKLWYHSGIENDPVTPVPGNVFVTVSDATTSLNVTGISGLQTGLILTGSLSGSLHGHLEFSLSPNSGSTPTGVYGLVMQITSPSYQASDPFLLTLANIRGLDIFDPSVLAGIEYGEQAIFNAAVPEPSSFTLVGMGAIGLATAAFRRRARIRRVAG